MVNCNFACCSSNTCNSNTCNWTNKYLSISGTILMFVEQKFLCSLKTFVFLIKGFFLCAKIKAYILSVCNFAAC